ncbi:hypothetical protein GPECTOR_128g546 [Gonium pectorale]|uniref:Uncharacterized protein n=1 Tax=Gonium pectorale TaxID=33097 RepID=A0A150FYF4_GONPE|nr:hypothetical protein GPECTOR_128g546 [Gonium pectorale]|eukprot:KXZ42643.1 hypothetical protein GPECTOR_128g546 [Gonium pectorale]
MASSTGLSSLDGDIQDLNTQICKVESQIAEVEKELSKPSISDEEKKHLRKEKEQLREEKLLLRKKEEQLRKKEEQLREEKLLLLKEKLNGAHHRVLSGACRVIPTLLLVSQLFVKARNREASLYNAYSAIVGVYGAIRDAPATKWLAADLAAFTHMPLLAMAWGVAVLIVCPLVLYFQNFWGQ